MKTIFYNDDLYAYIYNNKKDLINYLIENEIAVNDENTQSVAADNLQNDYKDLISCLREYDNKNNYDYILVSGSLGLWYGRKQIKVKIKSLEETINQINKYDQLLIYFDKKNSTVSIDSYHHDGCNTFKLYAVKNNKKRAIKLNDLLSCY